jgi:two-component system, NtrC family, sensor kinase
MRQIKPDHLIRLSRGSPSLATTLILVLLLPLMLATALTGWYSITNLERQTEVRMQKDIELVARAIRLPLSHALERGYQRTVQQALDSAFSIDRVYGVYVYDSEGSTVAASGFRQGTVDTDKAAQLASRGVRQGEFDRMAGEEVFSYFVPLTDAGGRINGLLQVTRQGSDFDDYLMELRHHTLMVVLVSGLVLASILLLGHRWVVGRHLRSIELSLERIGNGDLEHRLPRRGAREFRHLSATINQMLDAIETSQAQLTRLGERLHRSEKMAALGQLAAGVAHELGSPLSTVDGKAQRLLRREDLPDSARQALHTLRREAARMELIIRQLLDFGRANPLQRSQIRAERPLRAACERLAQGSPVPVHLELKDHYPLIRVDSVRLDQALSNLLDNALQAAKQQVRAGIEQDGNWLCYQIDDDGPGVASDIRPHLFEPFFTTKPVGQGTGLGLAVAHAAARDHGGEIEISQTPMGGARFTLKLPMQAEDDHA